MRLLRSGPLTMAPSQLGIFAKSSPEHATAESCSIHVQPLSLDSRFGEPLHPFAGLHRQRLQSAPDQPRPCPYRDARTPSDAPAISPNYLDTQADRQVAIDAMKLTRRIVGQAPLARFRPQEHLPGPAATSDEDLLDASARLGTTIFHPVGTAKMGRPDDARAVLDERLRVRGVTGLRVIDASVMPAITSGNTATSDDDDRRKGRRDDAGGREGGVISLHSLAAAVRLIHAGRPGRP